MSKLGGGVKVIWTQSKRTANFVPGDRPLGSWVDCCSAGIWVIHTGPKSGGELVTLFGSCCDDGASVVIGVQQTTSKSRGELVTLFGSCYDDGVRVVTFLLRDMPVFIYITLRQFYC